MYQSVSPPLAKPQIRECSRNSPTIERTEMFSEMPLTPGSSEQPARLMMSTRTPAFDAR